MSFKINPMLDRKQSFLKSKIEISNLIPLLIKKLHMLYLYIKNCLLIYNYNLLEYKSLNLNKGLHVGLTLISWPTINHFWFKNKKSFLCRSTTLLHNIQLLLKKKNFELYKILTDEKVNKDTPLLLHIKRQRSLRLGKLFWKKKKKKRNFIKKHTKKVVKTFAQNLEEQSNQNVQVKNWSKKKVFIFYTFIKKKVNMQEYIYYKQKSFKLSFKTKLLKPKFQNLRLKPKQKLNKSKKELIKKQQSAKIIKQKEDLQSRTNTIAKRIDKKKKKWKKLKKAKRKEEKRQGARSKRVRPILLHFKFHFNLKKKKSYYTNSWLLFTKTKKRSNLNFRCTIKKRNTLILKKGTKKMNAFLLQRIMCLFLIKKVSMLFDKRIFLRIKNLDWNSNIVLRELNKWMISRFLSLPRYKFRPRKFRKFILALYIVHISIYTKVPHIIVTYMAQYLPRLKRFWFFIYFMLELLKFNSIKLYAFNGVKLQVKGRFQRRRRVRTFTKKSLYFPWATLKYKIFAAKKEAYTMYGMFSIRLWLQYIR